VNGVPRQRPDNQHHAAAQRRGRLWLIIQVTCTGRGHNLPLRGTPLEVAMAERGASHLGTRHQRFEQHATGGILLVRLVDGVAPKEPASRPSRVRRCAAPATDARAAQGIRVTRPVAPKGLQQIRQLCFFGLLRRGRPRRRQARPLRAAAGSAGRYRRNLGDRYLASHQRLPNGRQ
jgi:hypothetical protein